MKEALKQALLKHDRLVPRYTSYPTAPHFKTGIEEEWYKNRLLAIPENSRISLYVHIPFCPKLCWFCGCHTRITNRYNAVEDYLEMIRAEFAMIAPLIGGRGLRVSHLHFGGGSPTILQPSDFAALMNMLHEYLEFSSDAEIAVEIDPRNLNPEKARVYAYSGVNRVSFGIQDFDQEVMESVNRPQTFDLDYQAIELCRDAGISKVNIDLMYGLPYQNSDTAFSCAEQALSLNPDRMALFGYAHVPWLKKHMRLIPEDCLPSAAQRIDLFESVAAAFEDAGYIPVGIDHFAREDDSLTAALREHKLRRNFQGYTDDDSPYLLGLGASSISRFDDVYVQNLTFLPQYRDRVVSGNLPAEKYCILSEEDKLHACIIMKMMCDMSVNPFHEAKISGVPDYDFGNAYERLHLLAEDGLIKISSDGTIHALLRQATRLACACFDAWLIQDTQRRHVSSA